MNRKEKRTYIRIICFLAFFTLLFGVCTIVYSSKARKYEFLIEVNNQRAVNELCESLDSMTVSLQKSLYAGTRDMLKSIGNELCRQSVIAKESLGALTEKNTDNEEIFKFLSQVGDYTVSLSQGDDNLLTLSGKDISSLRALYNYCSALSSEISLILADYDAGNVSFGQTLNTLSVDSSELPENFFSRMESTKQTVSDYPTLLYDGPYSDSILNKKSAFLTNQREITKQEAKKIAADAMNKSLASLREDEDINSEIELFTFSVADSSVSVTKKGGYLCDFIAEAYAGTASISPKEAVKRGLSYLEKYGYKSMTDSYYSVYDGICTVNYAYEKDGIVYYSDLVKVSISLENGDMVGFDAKGYLMNHKNRTLPEIKASERGCRNIISSSLQVLGCKKALIPLETGKEALCYEFHCKDRNGKEALIYIDCETGKEKDIMLLLYEDGGILTR